MQGAFGDAVPTWSNVDVYILGLGCSVQTLLWGFEFVYITWDSVGFGVRGSGIGFQSGLLTVVLGSRISEVSDVAFYVKL